jgi:hypothetical protein
LYGLNKDFIGLKKHPDWDVFFYYCLVQKEIYAIFATFLVRREILRAARFFGITLPADFINLLSAARVAATAATLSPDSIALTAFLVAVLTALRRAVLTTFFFSVTKTLFFADL